MPPSSKPPEDQRSVKPFDPLTLDRTVIALPLLRDMKEDFDLIEKLKAKYPEAILQFNCAIEVDTKYKGGPKAAHQAVLRMAAEAADKALATLRKRGGDAKRVAALEEAIAEQTVEPPLEGTPYCLARLHAAVIRRLVGDPVLRVYPKRFDVIIDLNLEHPGGRDAARQWVVDHIDEVKKAADVRDAGQEIHWEKYQRDGQYIFARLEGRVIRNLVDMDLKQALAAAEVRREMTKDQALKSRIDPLKFRSIYHIWPDFEVSACINKSIATVKADAAHNSFSALGAGITWAVMDSGLDRTHKHFDGIVDEASTLHRDFTTDGGGAFEDENGHGTHVAGIIGGFWSVSPETPLEERPLAVTRHLNKDTEDVEYEETRLETVSGMAPKCQLVSLRVLDENGKGSVSNLIAAIAHIQEVNGHGRRLIIHGVNMSIGYNFEPEWFACGHSPLCVEVDRLVKSGVVVVVAAGNTGYGTLKSEIGATAAGLGLTINDPGNSDLAITVGSTHRDMPHLYGVSYFSSKGPTGDGRIKPDLVAPGEKIVSCATGKLKKDGAKGKECNYVETSGTSMAAPHVSGVIAAFLSVRREFIGQPERVKEIFLRSATDLRRDRYFQGAGLVDLMRAIQSI